jgi:hypothetical protein
MADIFTTAAIAIRRLGLPGFQSFAIGASLKALPGAIGEALKMAYVNPYTSRRQPPPDEDLEGRDPNW